MITTSVRANPYFKPVYEYAIANIIGAYIPYVLFPITYLAILTIVATIHIDINISNKFWDTPCSIIHCVNSEVSNIYS